jgi:hypothetical protein
MIHGGTTLLRFKNVESGGAESGFSDGLHEGAEEALALGRGESIKEEVVLDANAGKIFNPAFPAPNLLLVSALSDCFGSG